jgi:uncharacterized protein (TIGR00106 family)
MLAELRLTPVGARTSFARLVADVLPILAASPLQYQVHAMGTSLEGELDAILALVRRCHDELRKHADRVLIELSIDDRSAAEGELVRSLRHVRELNVDAPLERLVHGTPGTT